MKPCVVSLVFRRISPSCSLFCRYVCPAAKRRQGTKPIDAIKPIDIRFKQQPGISIVRYFVRPDCAQISVPRLTCRRYANLTEAIGSENSPGCLFTRRSILGDGQLSRSGYNSSVESVGQEKDSEITTIEDISKPSIFLP